MKGYIYSLTNHIDSTEIYFVYANFIAITKAIRYKRKPWCLYEVEYEYDPLIRRSGDKIVPVSGKYITITKKLYENKKEKYKKKSKISQDFTLEDLEKTLDDLFNVGSSD